MKPHRSTYFGVIALTMMLLLTLFPHHHHEGGAACWVTEVCHQDGRENDVHTHHEDNHHAHAAYLAPSHGQVRASQLGAGQSDWSLFLPFDFWQGQSVEIASAQSISSLPYVRGNVLASVWKHCLRRGPPMGMC